MAPGGNSHGSSSMSKKPSGQDSNDERSYQSRSNSNSKNTEKGSRSGLLKSIFSNRSEATGSVLMDSALFRDEISRPSSSSLRTRPPKTEMSKTDTYKSEKIQPGKKSEKPKIKKQKSKKYEPAPDEEYVDEPDFDDFKSVYIATPVEKKKEEKKQESRRGPSNSQANSSIPAPKIQTAFVSEYDIKMATKQTHISQLTGSELEQQEKWAHEKLKAVGSSCPMGFRWYRFKQESVHGQEAMDGYRCKAGACFVTHELLSQGEGKQYINSGKFEEFLMRVLHGYVHPHSRFCGKRWDGPLVLPKDPHMEQLHEMAKTNPLTKMQLDMEDRRWDMQYSNARGGPWWEGYTFF